MQPMSGDKLQQQILRSYERMCDHSSLKDLIGKQQENESNNEFLDSLSIICDLKK